jgi:hypothetical protein
MEFGFRAMNSFLRYHPRPVYARGFAGLQCQSAEALAKAGKPVIQYSVTFVDSLDRRGVLDARWSLSSGRPKAGPVGGHDSE